MMRVPHSMADASRTPGISPSLIGIGLVLLGAACAPRTVPAPAPCAAAFADSLSRATVVGLDRMAEHVRWDDYTLAHYPVVILGDSVGSGDAEVPACVALWRRGAGLQALALTSRPRLMTPLYGMLNLDTIGGAAVPGADAMAAHWRMPARDAATLRAAGVSRAIVLPATGSVLRRADLAVHEGFHLHVQFPEWFDLPRRHAWPSWDRQPDRVGLRERCYAGSPGLAILLRAEIDTLVAAFDALAGGTPADREVALRYARRAIELRARRRVLQDTMTVDRGGSRIPCALAEDLMELEEGVPQWVGHSTAVRAGLRTRASLRTPYAGSQAESFYQTGPLQLWILEGLLDEDALRAVTRAIARSTGPDGGVSASFERIIREVDASR